MLRYQLGDHLGGAHLVVGGSGLGDSVLIDREEYTPYGETSFGGLTRERYRFNGKEKLMRRTASNTTAPGTTRRDSSLGQLRSGEPGRGEATLGPRPPVPAISPLLRTPWPSSIGTGTRHGRSTSRCRTSASATRTPVATATNRTADRVTPGER